MYDCAALIYGGGARSRRKRASELPGGGLLVGERHHDLPGVEHEPLARRGRRDLLQVACGDNVLKAHGRLPFLHIVFAGGVR